MYTIIKPIPQIGGLPGDWLFIRPGVNEHDEDDDAVMVLRREFYSEMVAAVPESAADVVIRHALDGRRYAKDGQEIDEEGEFLSSGQAIRLVPRGEAP